MTDLILAQLTDPFRIGLLIALVFTMLRTRAATGQLLPLAAGAVFVAVVIPSTMPKAGVSLIQDVTAGLVSNLIILAIVLGLWAVVQRFRG